MIAIRDLEFDYGDREFALRVPELDVADGDRVAVVGPSGSGKTTLLHLIAGIRAPRAGHVSTAGIDLTTLDDRARRELRICLIGLVFQEFELLEYLDVCDNILLPYRVNASLDLTAAVRARADRLATSVGIASKLGKRPDELSQGERQRVAVCRALIAEPRLLLADEPTGNLDPANKTVVIDLLLEHARASGATLVTVTHDHDLLDRFERVIDVKEFHAGPGAEAS